MIIVRAKMPRGVLLYCQRARSAEFRQTVLRRVADDAFAP
jgi:hypothetical protein